MPIVRAVTPTSASISAAAMDSRSCAPIKAAPAAIGQAEIAPVPTGPAAAIDRVRVKGPGVTARAQASVRLAAVTGLAQANAPAGAIVPVPVNDPAAATARMPVNGRPARAAVAAMPLPVSTGAVALRGHKRRVAMRVSEATEAVAEELRPVAEAASGAVAVDVGAAAVGAVQMSRSSTTSCCSAISRTALAIIASAITVAIAPMSA